MVVVPFTIRWSVTVWTTFVVKVWVNCVVIGTLIKTGTPSTNQVYLALGLEQLLVTAVGSCPGSDVFVKVMGALVQPVGGNVKLFTGTFKILA